MLNVPDNMNWLCEFYNSLCDGDWEHGIGFVIENIDNPGWAFSFDFLDTPYSGKHFTPIDLHRTDDDWIVCRLEDGKFVGYCSPLNLPEILSRFRAWIEGNS